MLDCKSNLSEGNPCSRQDFLEHVASQRHPRIPGVKTPLTKGWAKAFGLQSFLIKAPAPERRAVFLKHLQVQVTCSMFHLHLLCVWIPEVGNNCFFWGWPQVELPIFWNWTSLILWRRNFWPGFQKRQTEEDSRYQVEAWNFKNLAQHAETANPYLDSGMRVRVPWTPSNCPQCSRIGQSIEAQLTSLRSICKTNMPPHKTSHFRTRLMVFL